MRPPRSSILFRAALVLAGLGASAMLVAAVVYGEPFASLGTIWYALDRDSLALVQRLLLKSVPDLWTWAAAPLLRIPLALYMLIPAAELLYLSRTR